MEVCNMAENVLMPKLGLTMSRGVVTQWLKKERDEVKKGEKICQVETDKITSDVESPSDGFIIKIIVREGTEENVLQPICIIGGRKELENYKENAGSSANSTEGINSNAADVGGTNICRSELVAKISPLAKKIADENHINISDVKGSGPDGRILKEDVIALLDRQVSGKHVDGKSQGLNNGDRKEVLAGVRAVIADRLSESKRNTPHVYFKMTVDASEMMNLKRSLSGSAENGRKPTVNDIVVLCAGRALDEFKDVNVSLEGNQIVYHDDVNIGMAVNSPKGLFVPVIQKANRLGLSGIMSKSRELAERARDGKLAYDDMCGGTFTVSNLGAYHIDEFFAIINPPESAILAIGRVEDRPIAKDGVVTVRPQMNICLSADHRVIDGALAARFMKRVKDLLENPYLLIL
jgi:pyruvate dehydrogenase E2 component (dihydrolipoamide acetyltransferase)